MGRGPSRPGGAAVHLRASLLRGPRLNRCRQKQLGEVRTAFLSFPFSSSSDSLLQPSHPEATSHCLCFPPSPTSTALHPPRAVPPPLPGPGGEGGLGGAVDLPWRGGEAWLRESYRFALPPSPSRTCSLLGLFWFCFVLFCFKKGR